jgi:hypothetical protein
VKIRKRWEEVRDERSKRKVAHARARVISFFGLTWFSIITMISQESQPQINGKLMANNGTMESECVV